MKSFRFLPLAVGCAFVGQAAAQEQVLETTEVSPEAAEPAAEASEPMEMVGEIQEVIVTATKRAENVREIPASISNLSGAELEERGAQDTADIVKLVPGVNLTATGDTPLRVTIRGISSDIGTANTTGVLFGNVTFTETYAPVVGLDPNPFDLGSVEVLKGPQGTLYGASALNGAVRYVPALPKFDAFETKYFVQYQSVHEGDAAPTYGAAVNVPLIADTLALRVMGFDRNGPGFVDNTQTGIEDTNRVDQKGARALLGWRPGDAWDILLTTAWQSTLSRDVGIFDERNGELETANRPRRSPNETRYSLTDLTVTYDAGWAQFVSDTSYVDKDGHNQFDATSRNTGQGAIPVVMQEYTGESETYGQEFRLVSVDEPEDRWKWAVGVFAWRQDLVNVLAVPLAVDVTPAATLVNILTPINPLLAGLFSATGSPLVVGAAGDVRVREYALFGDLTRRLGDDVEIAFGGRFYRTKSGGENVQSGLTTLAIHGQTPYTVKDGVKERGFNPKVSALWHVTDDVLTYGSVSKGFRVGGVQFGLTTPLSQTQAPSTFKSDTLWNYEAGLRTQWLDNTLRLDLTGFFVDWKQPQSLQQDASGLVLYIDNVGGVESKGADLAVQYLLPWAGVMFTGAATYAKTVTSKDFTTSNGTVIPAGGDWPLAPRWQTATSLSFLRPVGNWALGGFATYTTLGASIPYFTGMKIFDYQQLDLQLSVSNDSIPWLPQIAVIFNNVTDERGITNAFTSNIPSPDLAAREYYTITPRSVIVRLQGHFGG
ncbi:MAG TPA: TonB-dependent receptor [Nevskiaceae bacterium]|nr:TonB-dependent receptor [Nevskiaceae bacterium]